jgi:hypothetical protein
MPVTDPRELARVARLEAQGESADGIRLDSPESAARWNAGDRPACTECDSRVGWSLAIKKWTHLSPMFVDGDWVTWPPTPHNVAGPEWRPRGV